MPSLYAEANKWSLEKCRFTLAPAYALKISLIPSHSSYDAVTCVRYGRIFQNLPSVAPFFVIRVRTAAAFLNFGVDAPTPETCLPVAS